MFHVWREEFRRRGDRPREVAGVVDHRIPLAARERFQSFALVRVAIAVQGLDVGKQPGPGDPAVKQGQLVTVRLHRRDRCRSEEPRAPEDQNPLLWSLSRP